MSKDPTLPITRETLQALSHQAFASVLHLVEAEDLARLTATPVSFPMPGQPILTPERAVQLAYESGMSTRYESLIALCLSQTHEALAVYYLYAGQNCPLPPDLDFDSLIQAATACQTNRIMLVRYHPHPFGGPTVNGVEEYTRCRLPLKDACTPTYDYLVVEQNGEILSFRGWGQPPQKPAETDRVASNA
jgi:hypothetical protein